MRLGQGLYMEFHESVTGGVGGGEGRASKKLLSVQRKKKSGPTIEVFLRVSLRLVSGKFQSRQRYIGSILEAHFQRDKCGTFTICQRRLGYAGGRRAPPLLNSSGSYSNGREEGGCIECHCIFVREFQLAVKCS